MNLTPAYGTEFGFQGARTSGTVKFAARIGDGGGLPGAVRAMSIEGSLRRQISRFLMAQLFVADSRNTVLQSILGANTSGATLLMSASLSRQLSERVGLQFGYSHEQQRYNFIPATYGLAERNRVWVSLSYQMERPVGR
jgi:hypothetical protein